MIWVKSGNRWFDEEIDAFKNFFFIIFFLKIEIKREKK